MNRAWCIVVLTVFLASCAQTGVTPADSIAMPTPAGLPHTNATNISKLEVIWLPTPSLKGSLTLEEILARRRSVREFSDVPLTPMELSQLLWAAQGITDPAGLRTAPSAGALYPLEVYAAMRDGVYRYEPQGHRLIVQIQRDVRLALRAAALNQDAVLNAPVVIVIAAVYARTAYKYGAERSPRYVHLEAGHTAQNVLLQAVALNLGAVPIGAFYDDQVQRALNLPSDHQPLYLIPVGQPR